MRGGAASAGKVRVAPPKRTVLLSSAKKTVSYFFTGEKKRGHRFLWEKRGLVDRKKEDSFTWRGGLVHSPAGGVSRICGVEEGGERI